MKKIEAIIVVVAFLIVLGVGLSEIWSQENITATWDAPTTNDNGTPLTDLEGYKLYYGQESRGTNEQFVYQTEVDTANVVEFNTLLEAGTWYFAVKAYDNVGNHSGYSNETSVDIPDHAPDEPVLHEIKIQLVQTENGLKMVISGLQGVEIK